MAMERARTLLEYAQGHVCASVHIGFNFRVLTLTNQEFKFQILQFFVLLLGFLIKLPTLVR